MKNQGVGLQRSTPFSFPGCRRSGNRHIGPGTDRIAGSSRRSGRGPLHWQARPGPMFLLKRSEKRGCEKPCPEAAGEIQEGLNAPVASGRVPAGATEGGDHLPRRCGPRGEANRF
jgi:hypothetical protein